jgi:hypothetical protein
MFIGAAAFLLFLASLALGQQSTPILPDPKLTTGDSFPVTVQDLCVLGYTKKVRNVATEMKREVYEEYGVTSHGSGDYEVDHFDPTRTWRFQINQKPLAGAAPNVTVEMPKETGRIPVPRRSGPEKIPPANGSGE